MLEEIIDLARSCEYDFRLTANPDDSLRHLFDEWVPYYRMKWPIARHLQPSRILEIGVRYGYSAIAFLDACPHASYTGIDLDSELFGGAKGAVDWARNATANRTAEFLIADSQQMNRLPDGIYDLVHIDGQQDQAGYLHDLEMALKQSRFILADGCFWTRDNFLSSSEFLYRFKDLIEFYAVIPGYAGELIIRTKIPATTDSSSLPATVFSSADLRDTYQENYYLQDCGGFDSFNKTQGNVLSDNRLRTVAELATLATHGRALDLGCGRGEISLALARQGFDVTAIDYSASAIRIAEGALAASADPSLKVAFHCDDANSVPLVGHYDSVVASDLIEHLMPAELDTLYARIARHLAPQGLFIVHTYPNLWFYKYEYARRLRAAKALGAYLPLDPRSRYEKLMHINEQSPRVMRRQLAAHFPHVLFWFADAGLMNPGKLLDRNPSIGEMRSASDLFAIASNSPIDRSAVSKALRMDQANSLSPGQLSLVIVSQPETVTPGSHFAVDVRLINQSPIGLRSYPPFPFYLTYHWLDSVSGEALVYGQGDRTPISPGLPGGATGQYQVSCVALLAPGSYRLRLTLVQEFIQWFDPEPWNVFADILIGIEGAGHSGGPPN